MKREVIHEFVLRGEIMALALIFGIQTGEGHFNFEQKVCKVVLYHVVSLFPK